MQCLNCEAKLLNVRETHLFSRVAYDICERCGGMWLDHGELDKITLQTPGSVEYASAVSLEELEEKARTDPKLQSRLRSKRRCLRGDPEPLVKMPFMENPKILLDYCRACGGIWLDPGELEQINDYIRWFDKEAEPSPFGRFLKHVQSTFWHKIETRPTE